ncbi:MAG TPA: hypothetical protein DHU96_01025, partial [Actinobacteria bacterium]|nr:hypothetical protein [Actinomycetota bacterium]
MSCCTRAARFAAGVGVSIGGVDMGMARFRPGRENSVQVAACVHDGRGERPVRGGGRGACLPDPVALVGADGGLVQ